ncbi:hypothetical protein V2J09_003840 [Rumex salicifolius]
MASEKVRVLGVRGSPFSNRVEIALKLKGVDYEHVEEDVYTNKSPDLLKYSPVHKKIPVLVHVNKGVAESQVIIEYNEDTWVSGTSLLPRDPYESAQARFWASFINDKLFQSIVRAVWRGEEQVMEEMWENLEVVEKELQGKRFFNGQSIGFVDIMANFLGYWVLAVEEVTGNVIVSHEAFPSICRWRDDFESCDAVKEVLPQKDKFLVLIRARLEATRGHT